MTRVGISHFRTHLSAYLDRAAHGETIIVCRRNIPVAEIRRVHEPRRSPRPIGIDQGAFEIPPEFYEPLPTDLLALFNGESAVDSL